MFVEIHMLQNFAPSNLNRDDTGSPKTCEFGGVRRARISSQSLKRAIRRDGTFAELVEGLGGVRTRRVIVEIAGELAKANLASLQQADKIVSEVFAEGGIERPQARKRKDSKSEQGDQNDQGDQGDQSSPASDEEKDNTKLIIFMDQRALGDMVTVFREHWSDLKDGTSKEARAKAREAVGNILADRVRVPDI
ncbi:MAG TPA: type I-E CRISPR-associated protein Cas7/Cse4/CasC, partial [Ktedonobacterales bacterium]